MKKKRLVKDAVISPTTELYRKTNGKPGNRHLKNQNEKKSSNISKKNQKSSILTKNDNKQFGQLKARSITPWLNLKYGLDLEHENKNESIPKLPVIRILESIKHDKSDFTNRFKVIRDLRAARAIDFKEKTGNSGSLAVVGNRIIKILRGDRNKIKRTKSSSSNSKSYKN